MPVLCPGYADCGRIRWHLKPKNPGFSAGRGTHNAEVEGSSPSLTTKINHLRDFSLRDKNAKVGKFESRNSRQTQSLECLFRRTTMDAKLEAARSNRNAATSISYDLSRKSSVASEAGGRCMY